MLVVQTLLITLKTLRFCKQHVQRDNRSKICINESSMRFPPIRLDFVSHFNLFAYRFRTVWRRRLRHSTPVYLKCLFLFTCDASYQLGRVWISWLHCWRTCERNSWVFSQLRTLCPFRSRTTTGSRAKVTEWISYPVTRTPNLEIRRR